MGKATFMSLDNMKHLIEILSNFFKDKYGFVLKVDTDMKQMLLRAMTDVDSKSKTDPLKEKNRSVLYVMRDVIVQKFSLESTDALSSIQDQAPPAKLGRMSDPPIANSTDTTALGARLERLEQLRTENTDRIPRFEDVHNTLDEVAMNDDEFQRRLDSMRSQREDLMVSEKEPKGGGRDASLPEGNASFSEGNASFSEGNVSFSEERNVMLSDKSVTEGILRQDNGGSGLRQDNGGGSGSGLRQDNGGSGSGLRQDNGGGSGSGLRPKKSTPLPVDANDDSLSFYKDNIDRTRSMSLRSNALVPTFRQEITQVSPPLTHLEDRYLMINSADRNWLVDTLRYKYKVRFTNSGTPPLRVPIYENNPTVPFTMTESYNGIPNEMGFKYKGVFYPAYDGAASKGNEIGQEELSNLTERNAHITTNFTNIVSLRVTNVTLPTEIINATVGITNINLQDGAPFEFAHPYVLLQIDELQNVYEGTNESIRRSFCQLQYDRYFKTPNGRGYVILKPVQEERKMFRPAPLSTLPNMSLSLIKPNGELVNDSYDGLEIVDIRKDNLYIRVTTHKFFKKDDIFVGDTIVFKQVQLFVTYSDSSVAIDGETLPAQNEEYISKFNDFINRTKGHMVISIGDPTTGGMYNSFCVRGPLGVDYDTGLLGETEFGSEAFQIMEELGNFARRVEFSLSQISSSERESYTDSYRNGQLINLSLQNTISMILEMKVADVTF
jgi:hypothetical protein